MRFVRCHNKDIQSVSQTTVAPNPNLVRPGTFFRWIGNESVPRLLTQCRFPALAFSNAKIYTYIFFSNKIYESNFIKQHSETVTVWNCQNADCSFRSKFNVLFIIIFGTFSFPIVDYTENHLLFHSPIDIILQLCRLMSHSDFWVLCHYTHLCGSAAEWLACWTRAQ